MNQSHGSFSAKVLSFILSLSLLTPLTPVPNPKTTQHHNLSPATVTAKGFTQTERLAFLQSIEERAEAARGTTSINIFQGYDVRGIALDHEDDKANLRPEDAFLITQAIAFTYQQANPEAVDQAPRILITGDHRETTQKLIMAAVAGAASQGFQIHYDSGHVPTGALNFYGLRENYDVIIQVTGSHNPFHHNGMKIAVRQDANGFFDPNGKLGALYGNQGKRAFELKSIASIITEDAERIKATDTNGRLIDIHGNPLNVEGSYLGMEPNRPNYGAIVQAYVDTLKARFGKLNTPRRLVVDPGNGMGAAMVPVLEHQGNTIERGLYLDVNSRPVHPADPSKDTSGTAALEKSGCRACIEVIKEINATVPEGQLPAIGVLTDGDGDRSGMIDEDGKAIRPAPIAILIYRRFILENKTTLEKLHAMGEPIKLALDVRSSNVLESITGVVKPNGDVLKKGLYQGVQGIYIPAGYPSHRDHVAKEIETLNNLKERIQKGEVTSVSEAEIDQLIHSFVSAEASGHYFAATDDTHPDTMIDDGIFYAARVLEILDTWNDFEGKDENIALPNKEVYLLKDIFSPESIPALPSPDEPRYKGHKSIDDRYAFVAARQKELVEKGDTIFRGKVGSLVTMDQVTDGVRILFEDGSAFLIRTSNTSAKYTSMIEGPTWGRVVEILEDAIAWLTPHEGDEFSIDDLRQRLRNAQAKAALENTTNAVIGDTGISEADKTDVSKRTGLAQFHAAMSEAAQDEKRMMGWLHADEQDLTAIKKVAADLRENFNDVIVIGIGGSSMGFKALHQPLNNNINGRYNASDAETRGRDGKKAPRMHVLEATRLEDLLILDRLDLTKTAVVVISKSGGTPEPKFNTEVVLNKFKAKGIVGDQLAKQVVLVTGLDQNNGELPSSKLRQRFGKMGEDGNWIDTVRSIFPVPNSFGGRYSVFSHVGLLPAAITGIDIDALLNGVTEGRKLTEKPYSDPENIGFQLGLHLALLDLKRNSENPKDHFVIFFYFAQKHLVNLGRWMEQLVEESLGDFIDLPGGGKRRTGPTIKPTLGTEDNHSFIQNANDVGMLFIEMILTEAQVESERQSGFYDEQGLTPSQSLLASLRGTRNAKTSEGIPNATLALKEMNEVELAKLMYIFEVMTMVYGHVIGLGHKTFTQGGVESYKVGTRAVIEEMIKAGQVRLPDRSI